MTNTKRRKLQRTASAENGCFIRENVKAQFTVPLYMDEAMDKLSAIQGIPKGTLYANYLRRAYETWFKEDWEFWDEHGNLLKTEEKDEQEQK